HALWKIGGAVELNHVCATLLDQPYGGAHCALGPFLQRTVGKVATQERARHATAHGFANHEHLVERDFERIGMAPQVHADRVSDGDDVDAGTVRDARDLIIPGDHAHALFPLALYLQERLYGTLACHKFTYWGVFFFGPLPS